MEKDFDAKCSLKASRFPDFFVFLELLKGGHLEKRSLSQQTYGNLEQFLLFKECLCWVGNAKTKI